MFLVTSISGSSEIDRCLYGKRLLYIQDRAACLSLLSSSVMTDMNRGLGDVTSSEGLS